MRVDRDILHSPKLLKLEAASGNPAAIKWLIALWGYCEKQRAWRFDNMSLDCLADACRALIDGEKLLTFLRESRFVGIEGKTLVVRHWEHYNKGLIQRWEAGEKNRLARSSTDKRPHIDRRASDGRSSREIDRLIDRRGGCALEERKRSPSLKLIRQPGEDQESEQTKQYDPAMLAKIKSLAKSIGNPNRPDNG